jgi:RimJ/RimL family protein N-acetyltransferase
VVKAPARIVTARLVLRPPALADAQQVFERYASDPEVTRYLGWPQHRSVADTEAFLGFSAAEWERWPAGPYLIHAREGGRLIGGTGLAFESDTLAATGYVLSKDAWGHGYATEALAAMVDLARDLGVTHLYALCHPDHRASQRVLEKCGFDREPGSLRQLEFPNLVAGVPQDVFSYVRHR